MTQLRVLVLFSNPPGQAPLRLDLEDRALNALTRALAATLAIERQHATELEDIHKLIVDQSFDVIQFSGHGDRDGVYLDKSDLGVGGEMVSAERIVALLALAKTPPTVVVFMSCYSGESVDRLCVVAPFVVSTRGEVTDDECIVFGRTFYEKLARGQSVRASFDAAIRGLEARGLRRNVFHLSRRALARRGNSVFVECQPGAGRDTILLCLDAIVSQLGLLGLTEEELCHRLARKLRAHAWIFGVPRENVTIPVGEDLFGEFSWVDARDVVYCNKLMRLRADISREHWGVWARLLTSYNDLALGRRLKSGHTSTGQKRPTAAARDEAMYRLVGR